MVAAMPKLDLDLLPDLSTEEFEALKASVRDSGVLHAVFVDEDDNVLDGRHRLKIDPDAPRKVIRGLTTAEKEAFVFRCNFARRNLSPDQKRDALKRMKRTAAALRAEDAHKWTQERVAEALGVARETVRDWEGPSTTNGGAANGSKSKRQSKPDARAKLNRVAQDEIYRRVKAGESQERVAADFKVSQQAVSKVVARRKKKEDQEKANRKAVKAAAAVEVDGVHVGDFVEVAGKIPDGSIELIFTDPPYDTNSVELYGRLANVAVAKLIDGGSLIVYCGHRLLPKIFKEMAVTDLSFYWPLACIHTGDSARMPLTGQIVTWKPMLWFVKGSQRFDPSRMVRDSVVSSQEKDTHRWQQSVTEASYYIENLTTPGGLVFDPFCGGGTTVVAAKLLKRRWITCDIDAAAVALAKERLCAAPRQP
jgi:ParB-like chromosome segregation protein Spo0J